MPFVSPSAKGMNVTYCYNTITHIILGILKQIKKVKKSKTEVTIGARNRVRI